MKHQTLLGIVCLPVIGIGTWLAIAGVPTPNLDITLDDTLGEEVKTDGKANPGESITLEAEITNTSGFSGTDLVYETTVDANTTLIGDSVMLTPIALDDSYDCMGNVGIQVAAAAGVLANDRDPDGTNGNGISDLQAGPPSIATSGGGQVSMSLNGAFTYMPAVGFQGADTFTYVITDEDALNDASTGNGVVEVSINVTGMIWFFDDSNPSAGDGRLGSPFQTLAQHNSNAMDADGDCLFIYSGSYNDSLNLANNQRVMGQGSSQSLHDFCGLTLPPHSLALPSQGARPVLNTTSGNAINLAAANVLRGLNIADTDLAAIAGTTFGSLVIREMAISGSGGSLALNGGNLNVSFDSIVKNGGSQNGIRALNVSGNANFGMVDLQCTGGGQGILFAGLGANQTTVNFASGSKVICESGGAVNLQSTTLGVAGAGVSLERIESTGGTEPGLQVLGTVGPFTLTGTGTTLGSAGFITNKTDVDAVRLAANAGLMTLRNLDINDINGTDDAMLTTTYQSGADAIHAAALAGGLSLDRVRIDNVSDCAINATPFDVPVTYTERTTLVGLEITNSSITDTNRFHLPGNIGDDTRSVFRESMIRVHGISGQVTLDNNTFQHGSGLAQFITADSGSVRFDLTRNHFERSLKEFTSADVSVGAAGLEVYVAGSVTADIIIGDLADLEDLLGNTFLNCGKGDYGSMNIRTAPNAPAFSGDLDVHVSRNTFQVTDHLTDAGSSFAFKGFPQGEVEMIIGGTGSTFEAIFTNNTLEGLQGDNAAQFGASLNITAKDGTTGESIVQNNTHREVWGHIARTDTDNAEHYHHFVSNEIIHDVTSGNADNTDLGVSATQEFPYESIVHNTRNGGEVHIEKQNQIIPDHDTMFNFRSDKSVEFQTASSSDQIFVDFDAGFAHNAFEFDVATSANVHLFIDGSSAGTVDGVIADQGTNLNGQASIVNGTVNLSSTDPTDPSVVVP